MTGITAVDHAVKSETYIGTSVGLPILFEVLRNEESMYKRVC